MKNSALRQKKILKFLRSVNSLSLGEILDLFNKENFVVTQITIIRDLKKLEEQNHILKKESGKLARYQINISYSLLETVNLDEYFSHEDHKRNAQTSFSFEVLDTLRGEIFLPEEKEELQSLHQNFLNKFAQFSSEVSIQKEFERIIIEFSWKSSRIEGNTYSLLETERLIKEHKTSDGKTQEEAKMILNHKTVFDFVLNNKEYFSSFSRKKLE